MSTQTIRSKSLRLILAAKTEGLPPQLRSTQFLPMSQRDAINTLEVAGLWFGPRPLLEQDESFRQIIPYIVLQHGSSFIQYTRTPSGGEARLHGRTSIGLGGHVDLDDASSLAEAIDLASTLENAANREIQEELGEVDVVSKQWAGLLVENDSAVGRVHIGMIGVWQIRSLPTGVTEDAIGEVSSRTISDLDADVERLETWSAMLLPWLNERASKRTCEVPC